MSCQSYHCYIPFPLRVTAAVSRTHPDGHGAAPLLTTPPVQGGRQVGHQHEKGESIRPPLNKKLFPVHRPGGLKRAETGTSFFFFFFFFIFFKKEIFYSPPCTI